MVGKKRGYNTLHLTLASRGPAMKFDLDQLVSDCRKAVRENAPQAPISEILARSLSDRASLVSALGEPKRGNQGSAIGKRSEEHTSELQSLTNLVCRLLLEKKKPKPTSDVTGTE